MQEVAVEEAFREVIVIEDDDDDDNDQLRAPSLPSKQVDVQHYWISSDEGD